MHGYVKFKFLNRRKIFYFFFVFDQQRSKWTLTRMGWRSNNANFAARARISRSRTLMDAQSDWQMQFLPVSASQFSFSSKFGTKRAWINWGGFAHRSTAKCENYCSCASLIYIFFSLFFFLSYLQALNKHFTKNLETCNGINLYINLTMYNYLQLYSVFFLE